MPLRDKEISIWDKTMSWQHWMVNPQNPSTCSPVLPVPTSEPRVRKENQVRDTVSIKWILTLIQSCQCSSLGNVWGLSIECWWMDQAKEWPICCSRGWYVRLHRYSSSQDWRCIFNQPGFKAGQGKFPISGSIRSMSMTLCLTGQIGEIHRHDQWRWRQAGNFHNIEHCGSIKRGRRSVPRSGCWGQWWLDQLWLVFAEILWTHASWRHCR